MSHCFLDTTGSDDTVRLLSNPLNDDCFQCDEVEFLEESPLNESICLNKNIENVQPVKISFNDAEKDSAEFSSNLLQTHSSSKIIVALCLCVLFMAAEMVGGYIAGSLAVVSDGAHLLTDMVGFLIALIAIATSKKKSSARFNLGFYRIEILATITSILLLWIMTAIFLYIAAFRLIDGNYRIEVDTMIIVSLVGVIINILMFLVLHGCWNIQHRHVHSPTQEKLKGNQSINIQAAVIHVIGDLIQSTGVFVSSVVIKIYPDAKFMDPVCTFFSSVIVICSTLKLLKSCVHVIMEGCPSNIDYNNILVNLQCLNGVHNVHNLSIWSLTLGKNLLMVHLAVDDTVQRDKVLFQAQNVISSKFGIYHYTIQIEKYQSRCINFS